MTKINFTEQDWERVERDTLAWWAGELERPLVYLAVTDPLPPHPSGLPRYSYWSNYPLDMPAERILDLFEPVFAATHFYGDAFPWWWLNFGPGIVAGFLGAKVHSVSEPSETVWFFAFPANSLGRAGAPLRCGEFLVEAGTGNGRGAGQPLRQESGGLADRPGR